MKFRTILLAAIASLLTAVIVSQAQVPGINSTLNSVFTLAYDNSTMKPTYSASTGAISPAASMTDLCSIRGSATKNVRVRRAIVMGTSTATAVTEPITLLKRSTANTGDGSQPTVVSYDSSNATGTAVVELWTAAPTVGTLVGVIVDISVAFPVGTTAGQGATVFEFGRLGQPIVLRGVAESLAVNLSGITIAGTVSCTFEWTEET